jgi:hypothetical protein
MNVTAPIDPKLVAPTNPGVEPQKIEAATAYRELLEKAGLARKPSYGISPPLGGAPDKPAPKGPHVIRMSK